MNVRIVSVCVFAVVALVGSFASAQIGSLSYGQGSSYANPSSRLGSSQPNVLGGYNYSSGITSQRNVLGGYNYSNGITSQSNIFGGYNYSNGASSQANIFGGQNYSDGTSSQPNVFGGYNYSNGMVTRANVFGGQDVITQPRAPLNTQPKAKSWFGW